MDAKDLAIKLHNQFCTANHVDGCSWGYEKNYDDNNEVESHDWTGFSHSRWLDKAEDVLKTDLGQDLKNDGRLDELFEVVEKI